MARAHFGQREAKTFAYSQDGILKEHADYGNGSKDRKPVRKRKRRLPIVDRILAWVTFLALAFAALNTFMPDTAVAAALGVGQIVGIGS